MSQDSQSKLGHLRLQIVPPGSLPVLPAQSPTPGLLSVSVAWNRAGGDLRRWILNGPNAPNRYTIFNRGQIAARKLFEDSLPPPGKIPDPVGREDNAEEREREREIENRARPRRNDRNRADIVLLGGVLSPFSAYKGIRR